VRIEREQDATASHAGASLAVWVETSQGARLGADRAGALRRSAESIGRFVAARLLEDLASGATTDRYAADQLVCFAALAGGRSTWRAPSATEHLQANLWLVEQFGARTRASGTEIEVNGVARRR
jgi:RNA 3'-terminal phosphate cyclase (ATP)